MARRITKRPVLDPTEHPRPHIDVPMSIFGDPFFSDKQERVGAWVHYWCHAVWKKNPSYFWREDSETINLALRSGWLVRRRGKLYFTGPNKDRRWLLDQRTSWTTYAIEAANQYLVKIGKATNVERRLDNLQVASPHDLRLLGSVSGDHEKRLHRELQRHRVGGEWFSLNAETQAVLRREGMFQ